MGGKESNQTNKLSESPCLIIGNRNLYKNLYFASGIDHEIISTVILLPSAESFKKGCFQLKAKVCARSTG